MELGAAMFKQDFTLLRISDKPLTPEELDKFYFNPIPDPDAEKVTVRNFLGVIEYDTKNNQIALAVRRQVGHFDCHGIMYLYLKEKNHTGDALWAKTSGEKKYSIDDVRRFQGEVEDELCDAYYK